MKSLDRPAAWDWRLAVPVVLLIAAFDVAVGYASTGSRPWVIAGLVAALFATVLLLSSGTALFLTVFVAKPFIDMLWFASTNVGGVSVNAQSIVSIAVLGVGLLIIMIRRIELPNAIAIPMAFFAASNIIAVLLTPSLVIGADNLVRIVCGFPLVFVVPTLVKGLPAPRRLLQYFMVVVGVIYVTILLQPLGVIPYTSSDSGIQRATGFYYHPWDVARYLVVALPLILAIMEDRTSSPLLRWTYRALFAATLLVTFFTYLKAAWIAILVEIVLWFFLTRRPLQGALVLAVVAVVVAYPARDFVFAVFGDLAKLADPLTSGQALSGRVSVWEIYWDSLRHATTFQIVVGQGFDSAGLEVSGMATHNDYLRLVVVNGVVGLLAYAALIVGALSLLARAVRVLRRRGGLEWRIGVGVQCMFAAYLLMGLTADSSSYPGITLYLWLLLGLVFGYAGLATAQERASALTEGAALAPP